ncbi:MAG: hypothetical protein DWH78_03905 [Planctomycetota bacterium]|nr:MAG: hypothetical protein DWH78_03905 [Planctomycetota bacterium]
MHFLGLSTSLLEPLTTVDSEPWGIGKLKAVRRTFSESFVIGGVHEDRDPGMHTADADRQDLGDLRDALVGGWA